MNAKEMRWTEQQGKIAKELCKQGKTAAEIAAVVKKTRNAVIGYLNRNGVRMNDAVEKPSRPTIQPRPKVERQAGVIHRKLQKIDRKPPIIPVEPPPIKMGDKVGIPFLKSKPNQCRYLIQTSPAYICGEPTKSVSCSWCEEHYVIVFQKPEPRSVSKEPNSRSADRRLGRH